MEVKYPETPNPSSAPKRRSKRNHKSVQFTPVTDLIKKDRRIERVSDVWEDDRISSPLKIDVRAVNLELSPGSSPASLSPREIRTLIDEVCPDYEASSSPRTRWMSLKADFTCAICCGVLIRPVDVIGCGHYICKTHIIDLIQHTRSHEGRMRCSTCRREKCITNFNQVEVDSQLWSKIQNLKLHNSQRRSLSSSRSLTPLQDRFNRLFFGSIDF